MRNTIWGLIIVVGGACGGGGDAASLQGIYEITERTQNTAGCEAPGPSILGIAPETHLLLSEEILDHNLTRVLCRALSECEAVAASGDTDGFTNTSLFDDSDDGWLGISYAPFSAACASPGGWLNRITRVDAVTVLATEESTGPFTVAPGGSGDCADDIDAVHEAMFAATCTGIESITATFLQEI